MSYQKPYYCSRPHGAAPRCCNSPTPFAKPRVDGITMRLDRPQRYFPSSAGIQAHAALARLGQSSARLGSLRSLPSQREASKEIRVKQAPWEGTSVSRSSSPSSDISHWSRASIFRVRSQARAKAFLPYPCVFQERCPYWSVSLHYHWSVGRKPSWPSSTLASSRSFKTRKNY